MSKSKMSLFNQSPLTDVTYRGDKLRIARMANGLSLEDIAAAIGKTRQLISRYEMGMQPTDESLVIICNLLGIEKNYLFLPRAYPIESEICHFRSLRSRTQTMTKSVIAKAEILEEIIRAVESEIVFPEVSFPDASSFDLSMPDEIERIAEHCRREWELGLGPVSSMVKLVEKLGVVVSSIHGVDDKVDAFSVPHQRPFIIRNDAKKSNCRFRFDIAHELGHLVLHDGLTTGDAITESQADRFASAFLMPRVSFAKEFPMVIRGTQFDWNRMIELKLRWKTSLKAIIYRASTLGLITPQKAKSGFMVLNTKGQTKGEWGDERIPDEVPSLLPRAIDLLPYGEWLGMLSKIGIKENTVTDLFLIRHPVQEQAKHLRLVV